MAEIEGYSGRRQQGHQIPVVHHPENRHLAESMGEFGVPHPWSPKGVDGRWRTLGSGKGRHSAAQAVSSVENGKMRGNLRKAFIHFAPYLGELIFKSGVHQSHGVPVGLEGVEVRKLCFKGTGPPKQQDGEGGVDVVTGGDQGALNAIFHEVDDGYVYLMTIFSEGRS